MTATPKQYIDRVSDAEQNDLIIGKDELNVLWSLFAFVNSDDTVITDQADTYFNITYQALGGAAVTPSFERFKRRLSLVEEEDFGGIGDNLDVIDVFVEAKGLGDKEKAKIRAIVSDATSAAYNTGSWTIEWSKK